MEFVWSHGPAEVKKVHGVLGIARRIKPNTVQSTMERLFRKGLLSREKVSHAYVYSPRLSPQEVRAQIVEAVLARLVGDRADLRLSTLIDVVERAGPLALRQFRRMLAARRRRRGGSS